MHLLLTDRLACPRCGPEFGLILLAHRMAERRVRDGELGCPNCRDRYPVHDGFADLRAPPRTALTGGLAGSDPTEAPSPADEAAAERATALLGVTRGPATIALVGEPARLAARVAAAVDDLEAVALDPDAASWADAPGVSRAVAGPLMPFFSRVLRGVVLDGRLGPAWIREAARVVAPTSRVVVTGAAEGAVEALRGQGLTVLAEEAETVVAARG